MRYNQSKLALFVVSALICFGIMLMQPDLILLNAEMAEPLNPVMEESNIRQYFTAADSTLSEVQVAVGTYAQENHGDLIVELHDAASGALLAEAVADISQFADNNYCSIEFPETSLHSSEQYYLRFRLERESDADLLTIYRTADETASETNYVVINGEVMNYNLCVNLYGEKG